MTEIRTLSFGLALCLATVGCSRVEPTNTSSIAGTYEYVYPHNTEDLIENHYLVLTEESGASQRGWYYGTSDDFDQAREGYLPGFFVAEMQELEIAGDSLHFALSVSNEDLFTKPVPLQHRSAGDVPLNEFEKWNGPRIAARVTYRGVISADQIVLDTQFGSRVFQKVGQQ